MENERMKIRIVKEFVFQPAQPSVGRIIIMKAWWHWWERGRGG